MDNMLFEETACSRTTGYHHRILSIDGGGMRGVMSAVLLQRITEDYPQLLQGVGLIAGTSAGALNAFCLASGLTARFAAELFVREGGRIFRRSWLHRFGLTGSKYTNKGLREIVDLTWGTMKLKDLFIPVCIPTVQLKSKDEPHRTKAKIYHSMDGSEDMDASVADVAMYTTAAPTFFPSYDNHCDGGLYGNNPSMIGIAQAIASGADPEHIKVLSIGTGTKYDYIDDPNYSFGAFSVGRIVDILLEGTRDVPSYMAAAVLDDGYHRLDPILKKDIALDDVGAVQEMIEIASCTDIRPTVDWLRENWD